MVVSSFYLAKKTGTYADSLAAIGLTRMLEMLSDRYPEVKDEGWAYTVSWPADEGVDLEALDYEALRRDPGYRYVAKTNSDSSAPHATACIMYEAERQTLLSYRQRRQEMQKARGGKLTDEDREQLKQFAPMPGWFLYQNLNVLQAFGSYNQLHAAIRRSDAFAFKRSVVAKLLALANGSDLAAVETPFAPKLSAVQALNPSVGKGINRPKPDSTAASGLPGFFVDWFEEWLRYVGLHDCANSYKVGDHMKIVAMAPGALSGAAIDRLWNDFVALPLPWASIQIDVLASLGLARTLVANSGFLGAGDADLYDLFGKTPADVVAGIQTAFFSSLGNAYALTNTSFIGLPGWFPVQGADSADAWISILTEHERVLRSLDEDKSEEAAMLLRYRDFLSAGEHDLAAVLDFWAMYACHAMRRGGKVRVPLFTIQNMGRLLMNTGGRYSDIVRDQGFLAVATAIRRATVSEQFHKARTGKQEYEIHYGLFQDLRQKARFKDQVVAVLSGFIASYNYENARRAEHFARAGRGSADQRRRPQVTQQQLDSLIALLDDFGSEPVTMLLIAYGSARDARQPGSRSETDVTVETGDDINPELADDAEGVESSVN